MNQQYKFTASEYSKLCGISTSALRKRRLSGKLEGQYLLENNCYLYASPRPNIGPGTPVTETKFTLKKRRRNIPRHKTKYLRSHMALANDVKQMARIKRVLREEQIEEITPELIEMAKERHQQKVLEKVFAPNPLTEEQRVDEATRRQNQEWLWNRELRLNSEERGSTNSIGELKWKNPLDPQENTLPKEKKRKYYW